MSYTTLVNGETLAGNLAAGWSVFDCRFVLSDPPAGERAYAAGHIPGARYLSLDRDLAGPVTSRTGRHPLPDPRALAATLEAAGVSDGAQVVAYDDQGGAFAARLWWLLRWLGHLHVAVLDGGWQTWLAGSRPVSRDLPEAVARGSLTIAPDRESLTGAESFAAAPRDSRVWLDAAQVLARVRGGQGRLFDARAPERFRGEVEPIDPVAGHIPGAVNLPYAGNLAGDGRFLPPHVLRERFEAALAGVPAADAVCMCGSGVTACHNLLAMAVAGLGEAKLYPGSWSEWIRDPSHPVARGARDAR